MLNILNLIMPIGAQKPFELLHAGDTHITLADERNDLRKIELAKKRSRVFPNAWENLEQLGKIADEEGCLIVHSGDIIDFVSEANLDAVKAFTSAHDCFASAGNHEFSLYVGEAIEDEAYRNISLAKVQAAFKNDIRMSARIVNGVKLIALDNGYYRLEKSQYEFLKRECAEGLPVILVLHTPLYTEESFDYMMNVLKKPCAYLCGVPESRMTSYSEHRYNQQLPDDVTLEACRFIDKCPEIKCLLTGHIHEDYACPLPSGKMQYCIGINSACRIFVS